MSITHATRLAMVTVALLLVGCGSDDDEAATDAEAPAPSKCLPAKKALVASLEDSLTAQGGGKLGRVYTVRVQNPPPAALRGFKPGVHVAAGQLVASGIKETVAWAVSRSMVTTGGGLAFGLDAVTREFSDLGTAAGEGSPARTYTDEIAATDEYDRARSCAESK